MIATKNRLRSCCRITYGVSFGVSGTLNPDDYDMTGGPYPVWPYPKSSNQAKIDDLWHAAVNGRGAFLSASNPTDLINSLLAIMRNIQARVQAERLAAIDKG